VFFLVAALDSEAEFSIINALLPHMIVAVFRTKMVTYSHLSQELYKII
jgi:hypothetical protein